MMRISWPTAAVAMAVVVVTGAVLMACILTHQSAEVLATVGGSGTILGTFAGAIMDKLLAAQPTPENAPPVGSSDAGSGR